MDGLFDSAWFKLGWAVVNAETLEADILVYGVETHGQAPFKTKRRYDAKRHCIILSVAEIDPLPIHWGLQLGDVAHNFRSSLDHLAWALVKRGSATLTEAQERRVYFPIAKSPRHFAAVQKTMLVGVRRADLAIVRAYQPYKRGKRNLQRHVFSVLDELSNHDKHRTVQPIWSLPDSATWERGDAHDCEITQIVERARRVPLQVDTELARFYVRKTGPNPDIEVKGETTADPAINERVWLRNWIEETVKYTSSLLHEFSEPPPGLEALMSISHRAVSPSMG